MNDFRDILGSSEASEMPNIDGVVQASIATAISEEVKSALKTALTAYEDTVHDISMSMTPSKYGHDFVAVEGLIKAGDVTGDRSTSVHGWRALEDILILAGSSIGKAELQKALSMVDLGIQGAKLLEIWCPRLTCPDGGHEARDAAYEDGARQWDYEKILEIWGDESHDETNASSTLYDSRLEAFSALQEKLLSQICAAKTSIPSAVDSGIDSKGVLKIAVELVSGQADLFGLCDRHAKGVTVRWRHAEKMARAGISSGTSVGPGYGV